jgi:hypothetical protein
MFSIMSRGQRLALWIVVCVACLSAPAWRLALGTDPVVLLAAGLQATLGLVAIYWLIVTTPPDAIRIGPRASAALIGLGMLWLMLASGFRDPWSPTMLVTCGLAVVFLTITPLVTTRARYPRDGGPPPPASVWAMTLALWHPLWTVTGAAGLTGLPQMLLESTYALAVVSGVSMLTGALRFPIEKVLLPLALVLVVAALVIPLV